MREKIKVLVIDDSPMFRRIISQNINNSIDIEVLDTAKDTFDARNKIKKIKPDVLTLDIEMPGMDGIEFLKLLMSQNPIPTIVISSCHERCFEAVNAGAIAFVEKPNATNREAFAKEMISKIREASKARVYKRSVLTKSTLTTPKMPTLTSGITGSSKDIIAIGASMGGVEAVSKLMKKLPKGLPPIVITQHMPPVFTTKYANRLDKECEIKIVEGKDGDVLKSGYAYLAPGGMQMGVVNKNGVYKLEIKNTQKVSGHCPSVDYLFDSISKEVKGNITAVILTGMGSDGAKGLLNIRKKGGFTIGQNKETCVVYGMPMVANKLGAVIKEAPLEDIPEIILNNLKQRK